MTKQIAVVSLFLAMVAIAAAYGSAFLPGGAPGWAPWALMLGMSTTMVAMMVMGSARNGRIGKLVIPFGFVFLVLVGGFGFALAYPGTDAANPELWLGLPPRAAVILYVIGFGPLLVMPLAYALTFDEQTLRPEDLERVRRHRRGADADAALAAAGAPRSLEPEEVTR